MPTPAELRRVIKAGLWPRQLLDLTATVNHAINRAEPALEKDRALLLSVAVVCEFVNEYGGIRTYFPKIDEVNCAIRDLSIAAEFDGTTEGPNGIRALSHRYSLSEKAVYKVLSRQRQLQQERNREQQSQSHH
jgi:Mor family transcriptional regulator